METDKIIFTLLGLIVGLLIGYYKSKADFTEKLASYVTEKQCKECSTKTSLSGIVQDLKIGTTIFSDFKADIAVIKAKLGIQQDIDELRTAIKVLDERGK